MIDHTTGKLVRAGTQNKVLEINFDNYKYRDWECQNPQTNKNIIISGTFKKRVAPVHKDEKLFNNIKVFPQPDTKRTILPEYAPIIEFKPSKKKVNIKSFSNENTKFFQEKKKIVIPNKESDELSSPFKTHYKTLKFGQYKMTQIATLPGPVTRSMNNINDDKNNINKLREVKNKNTNYINKLRNDYCSKINCLPNTLINNDKRINRGKSYNNFNYKNKDSNNYDNSTSNRGKKRIRREKTNKEKIRPFSSNHYNYNNIKINNNYNNENNTNMIYKNEESYETFDMLKPSCIFDREYKLRFKIV